MKNPEALDWYRFARMDFFDKSEFITQDLEMVVAPLDVDRFLEFVVTAHRETFNITFRSDITDEFIDKELARMRAAYTNDENSVVGAFVGSDIVGLAVLETGSRDDDSHFGWIHFYYVSPQFRRHGVGSQLVRYSVEYFTALGLTEFFFAQVNTMEKRKHSIIVLDFRVSLKGTKLVLTV